MKSQNANKHIISFRVSSDEHHALLEQARKHGLNLSQLLRKNLPALRRGN